jgi:hypothetical protein
LTFKIIDIIVQPSSANKEKTKNKMTTETDQKTLLELLTLFDMRDDQIDDLEVLHERIRRGELTIDEAVRLAEPILSDFD